MTPSTECDREPASLLMRSFSFCSSQDTIPLSTSSVSLIELEEALRALFSLLDILFGGVPTSGATLAVGGLDVAAAALLRGGEGRVGPLGLDARYSCLSLSERLMGDRESSVMGVNARGSDGGTLWPEYLVAALRLRAGDLGRSSCTGGGRDGRGSVACVRIVCARLPDGRPP